MGCGRHRDEHPEIENAARRAESHGEENAEQECSQWPESFSDQLLPWKPNLPPRLTNSPSSLAAEPPHRADRRSVRPNQRHADHAGRRVGRGWSEFLSHGREETVPLLLPHGPQDAPLRPLAAQDPAHDGDDTGAYLPALRRPLRCCPGGSLPGKEK